MNGESSSAATASTSNQFDTNFAFPTDKVTTSEQKDDKDTNQSEIHSSELPLLLDPPLTEEEISADLSAIINEASDLDELDMMIQSVGPFQHPRSVAQNYGHANTNMYHRQPSYHSQHHHQVCSIFLFFIKSICCANRLVFLGINISFFFFHSG